MTEAKPILNNWPRLLSHITRPSTVVPQTVRFCLSEGDLTSIINKSESVSSIPLADLSQQKSAESQITELSPNEDINTVNANRISTPSLIKSSVVNDQIHITKEKEQSITTNCFKRWCIRSTFMQKIILVLMIMVLLITGIVAAVVTPIYLFVLPQFLIESSFTNLTPSVCSTTTCIGKETPYRTSIITALYPFDGNSNSLNGEASGTPYGNTLPGYVTTNYVGTNALNLPGTTPQYIQIPSVNLAQNFTLQVWLYPISLAGDFGIFGQCDSNSKCLSLSLRNGRFTLSFDSMNITNNTLTSSSFINANVWTHLTVAYDAVLLQQQIYVNGQIDAITSGIATPYAGVLTGSITTIGRSVSSAYGLSYFQGRIDHFTISAGVTRTACQIYNDASLLAYYPFNSIGTLNDYSVNLFQGMASGVSSISHGVFGQALYFSSSTSFFQAECFPSMATTPISFSISLWLNPVNTTSGGSLVHVSSLLNGSGVCYDLLAFSSSGALIVQLMQTTLIVNGTVGPILPTNTWTHLAVVFGTSNGIRIYVNGLLSTTSVGAAQGLNGVTSPQFITLGNNGPLGSSTSISCRNGSIPIIPGPYKGAIDEFRLYNRELNNEEICVLANL